MLVHKTWLLAVKLFTAKVLSYTMLRVIKNCCISISTVCSIYVFDILTCLFYPC